MSTVLAPPIGMMNQVPSWMLGCHRPEERLHDKVFCNPGTHCIPDYFSGEFPFDTGKPHLVPSIKYSNLVFSSLLVWSSAYFLSLRI